jgi:hypothetical protein
MLQKNQQFRPICLLNCLYKWYTKTGIGAPEPIDGRIIHKAQTTFIKGRDIMTSVLALHEILHETKTKSGGGLEIRL